MSETEPTDVVRARRFELVDEGAHTIAELGNLGGSRDAPFFGLALLDAHAASESGSGSTTRARH